ncbi:hypothetical protein PFISCL1PPCAC_9316, partial [Pristionchus fissidentatus]
SKMGVSRLSFMLLISISVVSSLQCYQGIAVHKRNGHDDVQGMRANEPELKECGISNGMCCIMTIEVKHCPLINRRYQVNSYYCAQCTLNSGEEENLIRDEKSSELWECRSATGACDYSLSRSENLLADPSTITA